MYLIILQYLHTVCRMSNTLASFSKQLVFYTQNKHLLACNQNKKQTVFFPTNSGGGIKRWLNLSFIF